MDRLSNSFSLLELDAEDAKEHNLTATIAADGCETRDSGKGVDNGLEDGTLLEKESVYQQSSESIVGDYKMPLVWIDLEMTDFARSVASISVQYTSLSHGHFSCSVLSILPPDLSSCQQVESDPELCWHKGLNIEVDRILEIACIITNGNLTKSIEGPDLVIHQPKECLDKMGEWCQEHHGESGLTERVLQSTISEQEAENQVIEFVKRHTGTAYTPLLAGNSVYMDLIFLRKYMPDLAALFSHNLVDVSSIKALCLRWYPRDRRKAPQKENKHRAMDDIKESIAELKFYKENIFKPKKSEEMRRLLDKDQLLKLSD
ncbi:hypothetical protein SASPL_120229 [Salvia splendens]|uniref:Exonuclease domain-containing protein n=1 Tax=Salvia splendens TaxID=180675 RepID=A0A8X8ZVE9_SALSN|nr:hypothetical protein SASPL_120229 [Salvia splendens]